MHRAAVWQHSNNSNIKIVHNSIEHFLWNSSDFSSDVVLSCLRIVFTNSVFQVPPQKIVKWVEILGIGWPRVVSLTQNKSVPWKFMPEVFNCSVWESVLVVPHFSNRALEYLRYNFPWDRLISHQTDNPWPSYSHDLNPPDYSLRGYLKDQVCENNLQTGENSIEEKSDEFPKKCSRELWIILMF